MWTIDAAVAGSLGIVAAMRLGPLVQAAKIAWQTMNATNRPSQDLVCMRKVNFLKRYQVGHCQAPSLRLMLSFVLLAVKRWRGEGAPTTYSAVLNEVASETQDTALN